MASSTVASQLLSLDLYLILDVSPDASTDEIKKSYRKRALKCHPDKNPDNPRAAELFHQLTEALKVLTDSKAKAAYDKVLKARKATALRHQKLDSKRKKLKEDLEARERAAAAAKQSAIQKDIDVEKVFAAEIDRLRKESKTLIDEQNRMMKEEMEKMSRKSDAGRPSNKTAEERVAARLKLKWKMKCLPLDYSTLMARLQRYGNVTCLVMSSKGKGSAVVEYADVRDGVRCVEGEGEQTSLTVTWLHGEPASTSFTSPPPPASAPPHNSSPQCEDLEDMESRIFAGIDNEIAGKWD